MSKLNGKAKEVLDACLSGESPEVRAKVYEIVDVSGLDPSDPMFLVLALTGQMRVLLEVAPADLSKLLTDWKSESSRSLESIKQAIAQVKATQQQQVNTIRQTLETVSDNCVEDIKQTGMATTSAIASANGEVLNQSRATVREAIQLKDQLTALITSVEQDRETNINVLKVLLERLGQSIGSLNTAITQINSSHTALNRLQQNTTWIKFADWFSPLIALVVVLIVGFGCGWSVMWLKYNESGNVLGRNLVEWNLERILKCQEDKNPKCTIWIEPPPEQRK